MACQMRQAQRSAGQDHEWALPQVLVCPAWAVRQAVEQLRRQMPRATWSLLGFPTGA